MRSDTAVTRRRAVSAPPTSDTVQSSGTGPSAGATQRERSLERDREMVLAAQQSRDGFAALYRAHAPAIGRYVNHRVGSRDLAEDLVADVFVAALEALPRYRHRGVPLRSWLYRIATHRVNRHARRRGRRTIEPLSSDPVDTNATSAEAHLSQATARAALLTLKPKQQAALTLHYLEGLSVRDVALALDCPVNTVKSHLVRGREALRRRLEERTPSS